MMVAHANILSVRRRTIRGFLLLLVGLAPCLAAGSVAWAQDLVLPRESAWRYDASGAALPADWATPGYDDSGWPVGPAILGYGESYIVTPVPYGPDAADKYPTTYFRATFDLGANPADVTALWIRVNYDDGFAAYLNGVEIARRSLPAGSILYTTWASSHEGGAYEPIDATAFAGHLVAGTNTVAVEVHQRTGNSSDLVFDLEVELSTLPANLVRGPYLQMTTSDAATIRWRTDAPIDGRVRWGLSPAALTESLSDPSPATEHEFRIEGLDPETTYYYAVGTAALDLAGPGAGHAFRTFPVPGAERPARVWVIGDSGTGDANAAAVRDAYAAWNGGAPTDVWLMLGDNAYTTGTDTEYQAAVFDMYEDLLRTLAPWPTRGNHDQIHTGTANDYYEIFTLPEGTEGGGLASGTEAYYAFDHGDIHFVCLDSEGSSRTPGSAMLLWLEADLAATGAQWTVAYWHHPPYTKGSHDSDNASDSGGRMRDMRENVLPILEAGGVDLVLCGHSHSYERSFLLDGHYGLSSTLADSHRVDAGDGWLDGAYEKPSLGPSPHEGSVYVVAGSSGKISGGPLNHPVMVTSLNVLGSLVLDVDGNQLDGVFLDAAGAERDHFSIVKGTATGLADPGSPSARNDLARPHPNPFAARTRLDFRVGRAGPVRLTLVDVSGALVRVLLEGELPAGDHRATWDGRDGDGRPAPPGVVFAVLETPDGRSTRKVLYLP